MGLALFSAFDISGPSDERNESNIPGGRINWPVSTSKSPYLFTLSSQIPAIIFAVSEVRNDAIPRAVATPATKGLAVYPATIVAKSAPTPNQSLTVSVPFLYLSIKLAVEKTAPNFPLITLENCSSAGNLYLNCNSRTD
ncbi:hypothetical protein P2G42_10715 [Klebsiella electrica]|uniref:hypothetical protein n=1 Tax=Klebsiella electrica TaxID=1259973 RepID=UPI0025535893|nr:hypothetical protein [Klebsiella electrica]WIO45047.1 hypothetical protein P2G42_10715 [Klebsiella electrica]